MLILEPNTLQKSYATKLVHHVRERTALEVISSQIIIALTLCYFY